MPSYRKIWLLSAMLLGLLLLSGCCRHDYRENIVSPTCTAGGYTQYTCASCGDSYRTDETPATGHNAHTPAVCQTRTCLTCHAVLRAQGEHDYRVAEVIAPTCQSGGYTRYACAACGAEKEGDATAPGGHAFDTDNVCRTRLCIHCGTAVPPPHDLMLLSTQREATLLNDGAATYRCRRCNSEFEKTIPAIAPEETGMPVLYITGSIGGVSKDGETPVSLTYVSDYLNFDCTATLKLQGASSVGHPKKNYTVRFYTDDTRTKRLKVDPFGWGLESKYCLKANYVDFTQARNVVCGRLFGDMVATRENQYSGLENAPNGGVVDGRPVLVYLNGAYHGFYTMNIPKDEWMFGMDNDQTERKQAMLFAEQWNESVALRVPVPNDFVSGSWELEYCSTEDTSWVVDSFNDLIYFVNNTNGEAFRQGIGEYLDVEAAIDNMLFTYLIGAIDNSSKNILWATYDGKVWIPSMYDMDGVCGLYWDGKSCISYDTMMPTRYGSGSFQFGGNVVWEKISANFAQEIIARYWELRQGPLATAAVIARFDEFFNGVPAYVYECDARVWPNIPGQNISNRNQIVSFMTARLAAFDNFFRSVS